MQIRLGSPARDMVTGFVGTVTSKHSYLDGTVQYGITPVVDKDGNLREIQHFPSDRIEPVFVEVTDETAAEKDSAA